MLQHPCSLALVAMDVVQLERTVDEAQDRDVRPRTDRQRPHRPSETDESRWGLGHGAHHIAERHAEVQGGLDMTVSKVKQGCRCP